MMTLARRISIICFSILMIFLPATLNAQRTIPRGRLMAIYPPGAQAGKSVEVRITEGSEVEFSSALVFNHPGITAKQVMKEATIFYPDPQPVENHFTVSVAANTPPGIYEVRALGSYGMSNARRFVVGELPDVQEVEPNNDLEKATELAPGSAMYGLFASDYDYYKLELKKGQRLIFNCQAQWLDSRGNAVLALLDAEGRELIHSHDVQGTDPMISFTPPVDGTFYLRVSELSYTTDGGAGTTPYRLVVRQGPWIDFVEPPVAKRGSQETFTLFGRNLGGQPSGIHVGNTELEKLTVTIPIPSQPTTLEASGQTTLSTVQSSLDFHAYRHQTAEGLSNPVTILVTEHELLKEQEPNDLQQEAQKLQLPAEVVGYFDSAKDIDSFLFDATKGEEYWFEITSQRLGQLTDPLLVVQQLRKDKDGKVTVRDLQTADDATLDDGRFRLDFKSLDPDLKYTIPEDGEYRVVVRDQFNGSTNGQKLAYQLTIRKPEPDFRMLVSSDLEIASNNSNNYPLQPRPCVVRAGGALEILLFAYRKQGFDGEITATVKNLPPGVTAGPAIIAPYSNIGSLLLHADQKVASWTGKLEITATATIDGKPVTHEARPLEILFDSPRITSVKTAARLTPTLTLHVDNEFKVPAVFTLPETKVWKIPRGGKLEIPIKLVKQGEFSGSVTVVQPIGTHTRITKRAMTVAPAKPDLKLTLDVQPDVQAGGFTTFARGEIQLDYRRNLKFAEQAKKDQTRIRKLSADLTKAYTVASQERGVADRDLATARSKMSTATSNRARLQQVAQQADQQLTAAKQKLDQTQKTLDAANQKKVEAEKQLSTAKDENAKKQAEAAVTAATAVVTQATAAVTTTKQQFTQAEAASKKAADEFGKAELMLKEAQKTYKTAEETRKKAGENEAEALKKRDLGTQAVREIDTLVRTLDSQSRQQKIKVYVHSPAIQVEVVSLPIEYTPPKQPLKIQAGESQKFTINIKRNFDYADEVTFSYRPPSGVSSRFINNSKIEKGKTQGELELKTETSTTPGTHEGTVTVNVRYNNRTTNETFPLPFIVEPPPKK